MHYSLRVVTVATAVTVASACVETPAVSRAKCAIELRYNSQLPDDSIGRVVIKMDNETDTVPQVLSTLRPVVTPDGTIHGIAMTSEGEATQGYDFDPCAKKLTLFPLPADLNGYFHEIALSPDARFVAYVAHAKSGETRGMVRSWPQMETVFEASPAQGYPSDVNSDTVEWIAKARFRISYRVQSGEYMLINGELRGPLKVDTLAIRPSSDSAASMPNTR